MLSAEDAVLGRQQHQWLTSGDDSGEAKWRAGSGEWHGGGAVPVPAGIAACEW